MTLALSLLALVCAAPFALAFVMAGALWAGALYYNARHVRISKNARF